LFWPQVYRSLPPTTASSSSLDPFSTPWDKPVYRSIGFQSEPEVMPQLFNQPRIRTMSTAPGTGVPFSSPSTIIPDVSKESGPRSLSGGSSLPSHPQTVSRSPGVEKLFQSAASSSSHPLSLALNSPASLTKPMSSGGPGTGPSGGGGSGSSGLSMPSLHRKTSTPSHDHKTADPRSVWASFRVGAMFIRCIVHPVHVQYLLCQQLSSTEWQVIEMNQENRKKMILGQPLTRSTYTFNEKHKIELCSLAELNTLVSSVKPRGGEMSDFVLGGRLGGGTGRSQYTFGQQGGGSSDFEELDDLPGFSEDLDLRMTLND